MSARLRGGYAMPDRAPAGGAGLGRTAFRLRADDLVDAAGSAPDNTTIGLVPTISCLITSDILSRVPSSRPLVALTSTASDGTADARRRTVWRVP